MNTYWEKEEFEDLVARSLISMYETKIKKHRGSVKHSRFTNEIFNQIKMIGCYFPPEDRIFLGQYLPGTSTLSEIQHLDIDNEGRPDHAIWCNTFGDNEKDNTKIRSDSYIEINCLQRISKLPHPVKCINEGRKYKLTTIWGRQNHVDGNVHHIVINHNGKIYDTYFTRPNYDSITGKCPIEIVNSKLCQTEEENKNCESIHTVIAHITIQIYQDRRYLWNVMAKEGSAKACFGVYPEQIKSLFYSRELPLSETGRKRPILHWVAAHQRRIKNGIDIDIEKYLRGTNEFIYQGTKFIITNPLKNRLSTS